jgi:hypothetical protein
MQAIVTKYLRPSNVKGSRIKAACQAGSITLHWDDALNSDQNHCGAAKALATKLGWFGHWVAGGLPDGSTAWVENSLADREHRDYFTVEAK